MNGRPILGIISGFFFGIFLALTLFLYGIIPLDSPLVFLLPVIGILLGLGLAIWAPFGARQAPATATGPAAGAAMDDHDDGMTDGDAQP